MTYATLLEGRTVLDVPTGGGGTLVLEMTEAGPTDEIVPVGTEEVTALT